MARRVNKKFVFLLIGILTVIIIGSSAYMYALHKYQNNPVRLAHAARQAQRTGDTDSAIALYQRAVVVYQRQGHTPTAARLLVRLGKLYDHTTADHPNRFAKALQCWNDARLLDPTLLTAWRHVMHSYYQIARWDHRPADWNKLRKAAKAVVRLDPKNAQAWRLLGEARLAEAPGLADLTDARFAAASHDLQRAIKLRPADAKNPAALADLYRTQADTELHQGMIGLPQAGQLRSQALQLMEAFVKKYPRHAQGWLALAAIRGGLADHEAAAYQALQQAVTLAPRNIAVWQVQAEWLISHHSPTAAVAAALQNVIALEPAALTGYVRLGEFYLHRREASAATVTFKKALHQVTGGHGLTPLINHMLRSRVHQDLTEAALDLAEAAPPGSPERLRHLAQAKTSLTWLMRRMPQSPWVFVYRGRLRLAQGRLAAAQRWLNRGTALLSPDQHAELPLWFTAQQLQVRLYQLRGESGAALTQLDVMERYLPGNPILMRDRAGLLLAVDQPAAALRQINQAIPLLPDNIRALMIKAQALAALNRLPELTTLLDRLETGDNLPLALLKTRLALWGRHDAQAQPVIEPWLKRLPADPRIVLLGYAVQMGLRHRTQAAAIIARAVQLAPDNMQFILLSNLLRQAKTPPEVSLTSVGGSDIQLKFPGANGAAVEQAQREAIHNIADPLRRALVLAQFAMDHGQYAQAAQALDAATKIQPASASILTARFQLALAQGDLAAAKSLTALAVARNVDGCGGALFQAQVALADHNPTAATQVLGPIHLQHPDNLSLQTYYGQALMASGQVQAGITQLQGVLQRQPDAVPAIKILLAYYLAPGAGQSIPEARMLLQQGLAYAPLDPQLNQWRYDLADIYGPPGPEITRRENLLRAQPQDIANIIHLAWLYQRAHRGPKALTLLEQTRRTQPANLDLARELAALYIANQLPLKAQSVYSTLAENTNAHIAFPGRMMLGEFYQTHQDFAAAAQVYQSALAVEPKGSQTAQRTLGDLYFKIGQYKTALPYYQALYQTRPQNRIVLLRYVETLIRAGNPAQGRELLAKYLLAQNPTDAQALALEGFAWFRQGRFPQAATALAQALAINPQDPVALYYHAAAEAAGGQGNLKHAIRDLQTLLEISPHDERARMLLAQLYSRTNRFAQAVYEYDLVRKANPKNERIRFAYAGLLLQLSARYTALLATDHSPQAATLRTIAPLKRLAGLIRRSLRQNSRDPEWLLLQGHYELLRDHPRRALAQAKRILAANPAPAVLNAALRLAATAAYQAGRYSEARSYDESVLKLTPHDSGMLNNYAYLLAVKFKQSRQAEKWAAQANAEAARLQGGGVYATNPNILDTLGWVRFLNGNLPGAYAALQQCLEHTPPPVAYYHIAKVLMAQNRPAEARKFLEHGIIIAQRLHDPILPREQALKQRLTGSRH